MKLGSSRRREAQRRKQRFWLGLFKWSLLIGAVVLAGGYAWYTGSSVARREVAELQNINDNLRSEINELQVEIADSKGREALLRQQVPTEELKPLAELIRTRVQEGVPVDRLEFIVSVTSAERACDNSPVTKRFFVQTPVYETPGAAASFADNTITVTASGQPAINDEGNPEAWYDTSKPVTVRFQHINGAVTEATGVLPLQHSVVAGEWEYSFNLTSGNRGIVTATADRCSYP